MDIAFAPGFLKSLKRFNRKWWHPAKLWYWFKCWAWKRYTTIKPRYLDHRWQDRSVLVAHIMFEILCQFVEDECSPGDIEWYGDHGHKVTVDDKEKFVRDELQELYDWWTGDYHGSYPIAQRAMWDAASDFDDEHCTSCVREEDDMLFFDPQYDTPENKQISKELHKAASQFEQDMNAELNRRLLRILAIREYMWT